MPIDGVYDGDTIYTHFHEKRIPPPLNVLRVRVQHIDTPEMPAASYVETGKLNKAKCDAEALLATQAKFALVKMIGDSTTMKLTNFDWGSYPRRIVADVKINGQDVGQFLINNGYAVYDDGKTSVDNKDWCK